MPEILIHQPKQESRQLKETVGFLKNMIRIPSLSGQEDGPAQLITDILHDKGVTGVHRLKNNVWAYNKHFDESKPTLLLNSHLDTVPPNKGYARDPYSPEIADDKLYGLGSNDAGGSVACLLYTFIDFYAVKNLKFNLAFAATAEEEVSGKNGIELIIPELKNLSCAIVGEPTEMEMAIAEKGLLVIDCETKGISGHAARDHGTNAIYLALEDIQWIRSCEFQRTSSTLGKVKMSVTTIDAGKQHNMIPDRCGYTIDIRVTDEYTHEEIISLLQKNLHAEIRPRSLRIRPSSISPEHPIVVAGKKEGIKLFASATTSDQALIPFPSVKIGPGSSLRSHTSDEFIYLEDLRKGLEVYHKLLKNILL